MEAMALHRPRMEIHPAAHLREFVSFFLGRWKGLELTHRHTPTHTDTHRHTPTHTPEGRCTLAFSFHLTMGMCRQRAENWLISVNDHFPSLLAPHPHSHPPANIPSRPLWTLLYSVINVDSTRPVSCLQVIRV